MVERRHPVNATMWRFSLAHGVAKYTHCQVVRVRGEQRYLSVVGAAPDVARWLALYERAEEEIHREGSVFAVQHGRSKADTWRKGAAQGFGARLAELAAAAAVSATGQAVPAASSDHALVLVGRMAAAERAMNDLFSGRKVRETSPTFGGGRDAYYSGFRHGNGMGAHLGHLDG